MHTIQDPNEIRALLNDRRRRGDSVGFVPTMGALHDGHLALCRASAAANRVTAASIFINPTQFGPAEDFAQYPRVLSHDRELLEAAGVHVLFAPTAETMYPSGYQTYVEVGEVARSLEGERRPGHFRGVATVVLKLFNIVGACSAYFGEKDYQQLQVIRRMAVDLNIDVEVVGVPTVREPDGIAMSSRNRYLSAEERRAAPAIYAALQSAREAAKAGERDCGRLLKVAGRRFAEEPALDPEYLALVHPETLEPLSLLDQPGRLITAVRLGTTRLIDNLAIEPRGMGTSIRSR